MGRKTPIFLIYILLFVLAGCQASPTQTITPITKTASATLPADPTPDNPDRELAAQTLNEWFGDNGGCELPCWWGIEAGVTSWAEIEAQFGQYADTIYKAGMERRLTFELPETEGSFVFYEIQFIVDDLGIVEEINPGIWTWTDGRYSLANVLGLFGEPDQVWLIATANYVQMFSMIVFYETEGIYFIFTGDAVLQGEENVLLCPSNIRQSENPLIHIWKPGLYESLTDIYMYPRYTNVYQLKDLTDWNVSKFYEQFSIAGNEDCIQFPKDYAAD